MYLGKPIYLLAHVVLVNNVIRTVSVIDELGFGLGKSDLLASHVGGATALPVWPPVRSGSE